MQSNVPVAEATRDGMVLPPSTQPIAAPEANRGDFDGYDHNCRRTCCAKIHRRAEFGPSNQSGARSMSSPESSDPHHGTFASGESSPETYPDEKEVGTFASGESSPEAHPDETDVGTFAEGEDNPEAYPDDKEVGTFASGEANPEAYPDDKEVGPTGRS